LYISLHGGGGSYTQTEVERTFRENSNNESWKSMYVDYYIAQLSSAFDNGGKKDGPSSVHVAVRGLSIPGITDTWDLLSRPEFSLLFEKLLSNLIHHDPIEAKGAKPVSPTFVDPNRVYLMGFSAGGDGVYRLSTTMPDRFTAANMSAGHPGGVRLENLANLPLCLQVGSGDGRHLNPHRDTETARCSADLNGYVESAKSFDKLKSYYDHECFIHLNTGTNPHNYWSRREELTRNPAQIISKDALGDWWAANEKVNSANNNFKKDTKITNTVDWVTYENPLAPPQERKLRIRNPLPAYVVWDLAGRPQRPPEGFVPTGWTPKNMCYWLMVPSTYNGNGVIRALYNMSSETSPIAKNSLWVQSWDQMRGLELDIPITVLLNNTMLDLSQPINVYGGKSKTLLKTIAQVVQDGNIQRQTLAARGDPNFIFSALITITGSNVQTGAWDDISNTLKAML
jgi:hypothetical protein